MNSCINIEDGSDSFLVNVAVELSKCTCKDPLHARHCLCSLHNIDRDLDSRSDEVDSKFGMYLTNEVEITGTFVYVPNEVDFILGDPEPIEEWKARAVACITKRCKQPVTLRNSCIDNMNLFLKLYTNTIWLLILAQWVHPFFPSISVNISNTKGADIAMSRN